MKKKLYLPVLFILSLNFLSAQYAGQVGISNGTGVGATSGMLQNAVGDIDDQYDRLVKKTGIDEFSGSPYTNDDFKSAPVFYDTESMGNFYYRYNAYNEEVEIKKTALPEEKISSLTKDKSIKIMVDGHPMGFATFIDKKGNTMNGYLTTLMKGDKFDLYRRTHVKFTEGQKAQNSFVKAVPNRFTHFIEYYYQAKGTNRIDEVVPKSNKLAKLFEEPLRSSVKKYIKENELDIKEEADLIKVFEYLNGQ